MFDFGLRFLGSRMASVFALLHWADIVRQLVIVSRVALGESVNRFLEERYSSQEIDEFTLAD